MRYMSIKKVDLGFIRKLIVSNVMVLNKLCLCYRSQVVNMTKKKIKDARTNFGAQVKSTINKFKCSSSF